MTLLPLNAWPTPVNSLPLRRAVVGMPNQKIIWKPETSEGASISPDASTTPTFSIVDGSGTALALGATGNFSEIDSGAWEMTLPIPASPDLWSVTITATVGGSTLTATQPVDVVAQRLVKMSTLLTDDLLSQLDLDTLEDLRLACENTFTRHLGFPAIPTGFRVEYFMERPVIVDAYPLMTGLLWGAGAPILKVPTIERPIAILEAIVAQQYLSDLSLIRSARGGFFYVDQRPWPPGHYQIWGVHGFALTPPDLERAAVTYCKAVIENEMSSLPTGATSITSEGGTVSFGVRSRNSPTGISSVDAVLCSYRSGGGVVI